MKYSAKDPLLTKWLQEFKSTSTQITYRSGLRKFKKLLNIEDLGRYMKSHPDVVADIRKFLVSLEGKPPKSIKTYAGAVKVFFHDQGLKIPDEAWNKIRRRGFMPRRVRAQTQDKKPTKTQLKQILNYADIKLRALTLFLTSSGARIGETLQLQIEDFDLEADPPKVHLRAEITKGGVGERTVFYSYEARDAIKDWLKIKDSLDKRGRGGSYKGTKKVFSFAETTARDMWNRACDKAGMGIKDTRTGRRVYHLHSLRKFFRTKIGLQLDVTNALMGHAEYLDDAYLRLEEQGEIAEAYKEAMANVSVYELQNEKLEDFMKENEELRKRIEKMEIMLRISQGPSRQEMEQLAEQQQRIIAALKREGLVTTL